MFNVITMLNSSTKIKIKMLEKGTSAADIARRIGVSRSYISHVIAGRFKTAKIRQAIADALGATVAELWPNNNNHKKVA